MASGRKLRWAGIILISFGFLIWVYYRSQSARIIPGPSIADWWAVVKARDLQRRPSDVESAMRGCEDFITSHSKAGVKKIAKHYELTDRPVKVQREYWVAVDYYENGQRELMRGSCHYLGIGKSIVLLQASTTIKY